MRTPRLDRDRQQWVYDYVVQQTGRVFHWDEPGRQLTRPGRFLPHRCEGPPRQIGRGGVERPRIALNPEAILGGDLDLERVVPAHGLKERGDAVEAVGTQTAHSQAEVDLGEGAGRHGAVTGHSSAPVRERRVRRRRRC